MCPSCQNRPKRERSKNRRYRNYPVDGIKVQDRETRSAVDDDERKVVASLYSIFFVFFFRSCTRA